MFLLGLWIECIRSFLFCGEKVAGMGELVGDGVFRLGFVIFFLWLFFVIRK